MKKPRCSGHPDALEDETRDLTVVSLPCAGPPTRFFTVAGGGLWCMCSRCWVRYEAGAKEQVTSGTLTEITEEEAIVQCIMES